MNSEISRVESTIAVMKVPTDSDNITPEPSDEFVSTSYVKDLTDRALSYLQAGYSVHFAGPAGVGKTTLAFHVGTKLGRPVTLIHGDDEFGSSDLVGKDVGYRKYKTIDNFIHSVLKTEEEMRSLWMDNRLTMACQKGYTLIYDEFNRSRPEANNPLLSVLSERILNLPKLRRSGNGYLAVHPEFRAIFTSNPEEYAGVHSTQDALLDRVITIKVGHYDRDTEVQITMSKSGIAKRDADTIVDIVRELRGIGTNNHRPTIRACIAIARVLACQGAQAHWADPIFQWVSQDVLISAMVKTSSKGETIAPQKVEKVIQKLAKR
ncbi:MAG: gas vesicle protein GvpN [Acidobacteriota bacterium]